MTAANAGVQAAGSSPAAVQAALDMKSMSPRQRVFSELVQTETNFVNVVKTILEVFKKPLDDPNQIGGQLLNQTELKIIFGNLPPIYDVHMKMLKVRQNSILNEAKENLGKSVRLLPCSDPLVARVLLTLHLLCSHASTVPHHGLRVFTSLEETKRVFDMIVTKS